MDLSANMISVWVIIPFRVTPNTDMAAWSNNISTTEYPVGNLYPKYRVWTLSRGNIWKQTRELLNARIFPL
jgi:hypothetical protein